MISRVEFPALSPRQLEFLKLMAQGLSQKEIAERWAVAPRTVKWHAEGAYTALGVSSNVQALVAMGWIKAPE